MNDVKSLFLSVLNHQLFRGGSKADNQLFVPAFSSHCFRTGHHSQRYGCR